MDAKEDKTLKEDSPRKGQKSPRGETALKIFQRKSQRSAKLPEGSVPQKNSFKRTSQAKPSGSIDDSLPNEKPTPEERKKGFKQKKTGNSLPNFSNFFQRKPRVSSHESIVLTPYEQVKDIETPQSVIAEAPEKPKRVLNNLSIQLDDLINEQRDPGQYRRTLHPEKMSEKSFNHTEHLKGYIWHTAYSCHSLLISKASLKLNKKQLIQIDLVRKICNEILEPVFKQYLKIPKNTPEHCLNEMEEISEEYLNEKNDIFEQAELFVNYMRDNVDAVMRNDILGEYPLLSQKLSYQDRKIYTPNLFTDQPLKDADNNEQMSRACAKVDRWKFHEKSCIDAYSVIFSYFTDTIDIHNYNTQLQNLIQATYKVQLALQNVASISKNVQSILKAKGAPKGFITLSSQLHIPELAQKAVIKKLTEMIHEGQIAARIADDNNKGKEKEDGQEGLKQESSIIPDCNNEAEFYLIHGSQLAINIQKTISDYTDNHQEFFRGKEFTEGKDGSGSPRKFDPVVGLAEKIKEQLLPSLRPEHSVSAHRSLCF